MPGRVAQHACTSRPLVNARRYAARIRDDEIELLSRNGPEEVPLQKAELLTQLQLVGIGAGNL